MDRWKAVMLRGTVRSRKTAEAFIAQYREEALPKATARLREARSRQMNGDALHWSRVAMWIQELGKPAEREM